MHKDQNKIETQSLKIASTAYYALAKPEQPTDEPSTLLIALHGWGESCKRAIRALDSLCQRNIILLAPQAPHQFYLNTNIKRVGFSWLTIYEKERAIQDVNNYLETLIKHIQTKHNIDPTKIYILGFSQ